jgi:hypothetical protein
MAKSRTLGGNDAAPLVMMGDFEAPPLRVAIFKIRDLWFSPEPLACTRRSARKQGRGLRLQAGPADHDTRC